MEKQFVTYIIAKELKELGFNVPSFARFNKGKFQMNRLGDWYKHNSGEIDKTYLSAPLWQQVIDWFETEKNIYISINKQLSKYKLGEIYIGVYNNPFTSITNIHTIECDTSYTAKEQAILNVIKLIKISVTNIQH